MRFSKNTGNGTSDSPLAGADVAGRVVKWAKTGDMDRLLFACVTPDAAKELLSLSENCRDTKPSNVKRFKDAVESGEFDKYLRTVSMNPLGLREDGFHVLSGIAETAGSDGAVLRFECVPKGTYRSAAADTGVARKLHDFLKANGYDIKEKHAKTLDILAAICFGHGKDKKKRYADNLLKELGTDYVSDLFNSIPPCEDVPSQKVAQIAALGLELAGRDTEQAMEIVSYFNDPSPPAPCESVKAVIRYCNRNELSQQGHKKVALAYLLAAIDNPKLKRIGKKHRCIPDWFKVALSF